MHGSTEAGTWERRQGHRHKPGGGGDADLAAAQRRLAPSGLGLKVYDAYRAARATRVNATGAVAADRAALVEAVHAEGFANYEGEWWHFNYLLPGASVLDVPVR